MHVVVGPIIFGREFAKLRGDIGLALILCWCWTVILDHLIVRIFVATTDNCREFGIRKFAERGAVFRRYHVRVEHPGLICICGRHVRRPHLRRGIHTTANPLC